MSCTADAQHRAVKTTLPILTKIFYTRNMNKQLFSLGLGNFRPHRMLYSIDTASLAKTDEPILSPFGDSFGPMEPRIR